MVIEPDVFGDHRGFFTESYNHEKYKQAGIDYNFIQDNHSFSTQAGTVRGMHFQLPPKAQTKLVHVVTGAIYDVVVDIRKDSETFGQWVGMILSASNQRQLLVPKGFAHGFCTIVENTHVLYKVDEYYSKEHDRGLLWSDPAIGINWPTDDPVLSDKDKVSPALSELDEVLF
ncbi:dTDP-4-dehydrorhamnose 3,5-epimerase [compost metagenome]